MAIPAFSQYWEEAGLPVNCTAPTLVYTDTAHDQLLAAGQMLIYLNNPDTLEAYIPLMRYNGVQWDTLGLFGNLVHSAVVYHDTLVIGGAFDWMKDTVIKNIACYAGDTWHPYGDMGDEWGDGVVQGLRVIDGELYAVGLFTYADGQLCNGLAKRVGGHWEPLPGWSDVDLLPDPWLHDIIRYQGRLVVGGKFNTTDFSLSNMAQYDGSAWVPVCANCLYGGLDGIGAMAEYQGDLYAGGIFYYASGNAGQGIMRWDGAQWYPLGPVGDGIQSINYSDQYSPDIFDLQVRDGLLYIGGGYGFVGHQPTPAGICTWDGTDFCLLQGSPFSDYYAPFDFYHDTLYGGTGADVTDPALVGVIRYLGELCATSGVPENAVGANSLHVSWSSSSGLVVLGLPDGVHDLRVYDAQGRLVLDRQVRSAAGRSEGVRLGDQSSAVYLVVVDNAQTARVAPIH